MTLIVLLILAGISLSGLIGEKGIFQRTENASNRYNEAKAREVLETVLLTDGQFEKNTNPKYNEEEFLNKLIKDEIPGADVRGDVAIIEGEYAYDLDRSVPKIGTRGNNGYLGNPKDLVWPDVSTTVKLADDKKNAIITIKASEEKQGINKIEIWLLGEKIKEYTYDPAKPEATENYIATQNGEYTIKAYGELMASKTVEVTGIVPEIEFEPNGNTTWKKEHPTKIKVKEISEKVKRMKYVWTNSVTEPVDSAFTEKCKEEDRITKNGVTGKYYLWVWLETEGRATAKRRSEAFYFDNQGPNIIDFTATPNSTTEITLSATANDTEAGTVKFEFYIDNVLKSSQTVIATTTSTTKSYKATGLSTGNHTCKVVVTDAEGNSDSKTLSRYTLVYYWYAYEVTTTTICTLKKTDENIFKRIYSSSICKFLRSNTWTEGDTNNIEETWTGSEWESHMRSYQGRYVVIDGEYLYNWSTSTSFAGAPTSGYYSSCYPCTLSKVEKERKGEFTKRYYWNISRTAFPDDGVQGANWWVYMGTRDVN